jgi:hypothetical protein
MRTGMTIILLLTVLLGRAQKFEGRIVYDVQFELAPKLANRISKEQFLKQADNDELNAGEVTISYKGGNYHVAIGGNKGLWSVYRKDSNRLYSFFPTNEECVVTDVSIDVESKITGKMAVVTLKDTSVLVADKPCKIVRVQWGTGYYDYYFSENYLATNDLFPGYVYDGWSAYLKLAKAYPVKIVKVIKGLYTLSYTLVKASSEKVPDTLFDLPPLRPSGLPSLVPNKRTMSFTATKDREFGS